MDELERLREELTTARVLDASRGVEALARAIVGRAAALSSADTCLLLLQTDGEPVVLSATHGAAPEHAASFPLSEIPHDAAVRHWLGAAADASVVVLALPDRGGFRGWLVLHTREPRPLDAGVPDLLQSLAERAAAPLCVADRLYRAEAALRAARETAARLGALLDSAPDPVVTVDEAGRVVLVNAETERVFGYERAELLGEPVELLLPDRYRQAHRRHRVVYGADPRTRHMGAELSLRARRKDGSEFPVEIRLSPLQTDEGLLISSSIRDVSDRERVMAALRESEEHFRTSFEHSPIPKALVDLEGRFMRVNRAFTAFIGYTEEELSRLKFSDLSSLEELEEDRAGMQQLLAGTASYFQVEKHYRHRDGHTLRGLVSVSVVRDRAGQPHHFVRQIQDVTEQRRAEEVLRQQTETLREQAEILDLSHDAIIVREVDGRIHFWNRGARETYGYSADEACGQLTHDLLRTRFPVSRAATHAALLEHDCWEGELVHTTRDGALVTVESQQVLKRDEAGHPRTVLEINRDITARKRTEAERDALLISERRKGEQLAAAIREAHHRIKNNLQSITDLLSLELALADSSSGTEALRQSIERIQAIGLVHDLLSRDRELEFVDVRRLTEQIVPTVLRANSRSATHVDLSLSVLNELLPSKQATALALILNELVSNAAKHAFSGRREGHLEVGLTRDQDHYHLCVRDDGPGLPARFDFDAHANVGMQVVRTLVEGSLGGAVQLRGEDGMRVEITFPATALDAGSNSGAASF